MPVEPARATPPPSIFLSYASEDRAAARALRETLVQAGLEVWLDEEELAGGDAWDAKIRQQIRTCNYFMPIVSATTEARREGYFRREWRFAVERTLDLADDVMFLVPVVVDDTPEQGARVPEKFLSVQWLRCPGGHETPTLRTVAARLVSEHRDAHTPVPPRVFPTSSSQPPIGSRPPLSREEERQARRQARQGRPPPPFPDFPAFPAEGHRARFFYDLILWAGHLIVALWCRLPKWLRLVATVVIVFKVIGFIFDRAPSSKPPHDDAPNFKTVDLGEILSSAAKSDADVPKFLKAAGIALDSLQGGRPLAVVAFTVDDPAARNPAAQSFKALFRELVADGRLAKVAIGIVPFAAANDDAAVFARGDSLQCHWLVTGDVQSEENGLFVLNVRLYDIPARKMIWQSMRRANASEPGSFAEALSADILKQVDLGAPLPPPPPPAK
jgi:hypothetical protein